MRHLTVKSAVLPRPLAVAVNVTLFVAVTFLVLMANVWLTCPLENVRLVTAGVPTAELLFRVTVMLPIAAGTGHSRVTVPVEAPGPTTVAGLSVKD